MNETFTPSSLKSRWYDDIKSKIKAIRRTLHIKSGGSEKSAHGGHSIDVNGSTFNRFDVFVAVQRKSGVYVCKSLSIIFLITMISFTSFALNQSSLFSGRMVLLVVSFLALGTFHGRLDSSTEVSNPSSLTIMDLFMYKAYFFLVLAVIESVVVGKIGQDNIGNVEMERKLYRVDNWALLTVPCAYFVGTVVMLMYALGVKSSAKGRRLDKIEKYAKGYDADA